MLEGIMNEQKTEHYTKLRREIQEFLNGKELACQTKREQLLKEERKDEADFEKIKSNIYHIMKSLANNAEKQAQNCPQEEQEERFLKTFLKKAEEVLKPWKSKYEIAQQQKDLEHSLIESLKLKAAAEVLKFIKDRGTKDDLDNQKMEEN